MSSVSMGSARNLKQGGQRGSKGQGTGGAIIFCVVQNVDLNSVVVCIKKM